MAPIEAPWPTPLQSWKAVPPAPRLLRSCESLLKLLREPTGDVEHEIGRPDEVIEAARASRAQRGQGQVRDSLTRHPVEVRRCRLRGTWKDSQGAGARGVVDRGVEEHGGGAGWSPVAAGDLDVAQVSVRADRPAGQPGVENPARGHRSE